MMEGKMTTLIVTAAPTPPSTSTVATTTTTTTTVPSFGNRSRMTRLSLAFDRTLSRRSSSIIGYHSFVGHRMSIYVPSIMTITDPHRLIVEINSQVALFRDMLIHVGQSRDCPELREKIRKLRRSCVEACKHTAQLVLPQVRSAVADGILTDNPHLVLLFYLSQLFLRELIKSYRLIQVVPMDMSGYYENRAGPSNIGNVISQILLCKQITPDFNQEELCSITKDSQEIARILGEMQEFMPRHETYLERNAALTDEANGPWPAKRRRNSIYKNMGLLCCVSRPNYL